MRCSAFIPVVTIFLLGILMATSASAVVILIPTDAATITEGLTLATAGDTLLVAPGLYLEHDLLLTSGISLLGATGNPADVVIDAQQQGRVMTCADLAELVRIEALTLTGGLATMETLGWPEGGGLLIDAAPAEVRNCRIVANEAETEGGGIACNNGADALISGCVVVGNRSIDGAGISCQGASPVLEHCIIAANDGLFWGGALFCRNGSNPRVVSCTLVGNEAHFGAGIWAVDGPHIEVENSIIAFGLDGEGIYTDDNQYFPSEIRLICCNVFGNEGGGYGGASSDQTGIDGNIAEDPRFCDRENFDFTLAASSPCLPENNGCNIQMGALGQGCNLLNGVGDDDLSPVSRLNQNRPNPFNPRTEITLELSREEAVTLKVYDPRGRVIRCLIAGAVQSAGLHQFTWDGRDDSGRQVPSGIYLYRLTTESGIETRKMTLTR